MVHSKLLLSPRVLLLSSVLLLGVVSCGPKGDDSKDAKSVLSAQDAEKTMNEQLSKDLEEVNKEIEKAVVEADKIVKQAGDKIKAASPASVSLQGAGLVKENKEVAATKVKVSIELGKDQKEEDLADKTVLHTKLSNEVIGKKDALAIADKLDTYVNLGCKQVDSKLIEGLKEKKLDENKNEKAKDLVKTLSDLQANITAPLFVRANTILLCNIASSTKVVNLIANRIIFQDLNFQNKGLGHFTFRANNLVFIGRNTMSLAGDDSDATKVLSSSLTLAATKEVSGEGYLEITSSGGEQKAVASKESKVATPPPVAAPAGDAPAGGGGDKGGKSKDGAGGKSAADNKPVVETKPQPPKAAETKK